MGFVIFLFLLLVRLVFSFYTLLGFVRVDLYVPASGVYEFLSTPFWVLSISLVSPARAFFTSFYTLLGFVWLKRVYLVVFTLPSLSTPFWVLFFLL